MALEIKQSLKLSQQLIMTPQLQQAIKLLQLSRLELQEVVNQEMTENPILEEVTEEGPETPLEAEEAPSPEPDEINWEAYIEEYNSNTLPVMKEINEDLPSFENALVRTTSLEDHLTWQLSMIELTEPEKQLGKLILGNLTEDGYLNGSLEEMAQEAGLLLEDAEEILKIIQNFDPIGVGSRNLQECLLIQARFLDPRQPLVEQLLAHHLNDLERKHYALLSKTLNLPIDKITQATRCILELEPKPGRAFRTGDTQYISPDIYVYKVGEDYTIVLNEDGMPKLRISPYYKKILNTTSKVTKEYMQERLRSALWLIRSIHNRQKTIYKVMESILNKQKDFFIHGVQFLKPMILKEVAEDVGMHESTVSRVTTNKFVHTPLGIFELKYFFNSSIHSTEGGQSLSSEAVKEKIRRVIQTENTQRPLSDQQIVELLKENGIEIARRTVAKYRSILGILSSGKRKKIL